MHFCQSKHQK